MNTTIHSDQPFSIKPFNPEVTPLFLITNPETIETIEEASQNFLSLVTFISKGNHLDDNGTEQACALLATLSQKFPPHDIFLELVPRLDGSCSGFTESILPLITSSNEALANSSLQFLDFSLTCEWTSTRLNFLMTGFFQHLPREFYLQRIHVVGEHGLPLMRIVSSYMFCAHPGVLKTITGESQNSMDAFHQIFMEKFFRPVQPFLEFIFTKRHEIKNSEQSPTFSDLLTTLLATSPHLEEMTQFVLSSSFTLAYTDSIYFFKTHRLDIELLRGLKVDIDAWRKEGPAVQKRGQQK
ncbi:hypothetical protein BLNAU_23400 [Blattamonas nauphoetae]|uniref:Uncharacterized protein n=1 Tax=Blattamonas nauphoetae TaxID=2049346 RepID=A0ABQ9WQC8_9EUKA|nr:hypothetical protein BLNAU_23781 [Blattamonas nauphoetae]KAK2941684.1 hypothetical protein BLNAU_23400 [Blattamonas nauphoetae]